MPDIQIKVANKIATGDNTKIVCGNSDYVAVFEFDAEWDAYDTKTARFVYGGKHEDKVFTGNKCEVPVIQNTRDVTVGVFAGDLHTTTPAYFMCLPSILCGGGAPADPAPDVYAQILELLNNIADGGKPATTERLGVVQIGENLKITAEGVLSVDTATEVEQDNTKPITSAAVHTEIGNIEVLLAAL